MKSKKGSKSRPVEHDFITIREASQLLNVSRDFLYRQMKAGKLPALRVGPRLIRINRIALLKEYGDAARGAR